MQPLRKDENLIVQFNGVACLSLGFRLWPYSSLKGCTDAIAKVANRSQQQVMRGITPGVI
eukprot:4262309-Amphidinium_carterae.1